MPINGSYSHSGSGCFLHQQNTNQTQKRASKRVYVNVLFRPIAKIRLNWSYFGTEPDTGLFLGWKGMIGGHIGPGWEDLYIAGSGLLGGSSGSL